LSLVYCGFAEYGLVPSYAALLACPHDTPSST